MKTRMKIVQKRCCPTLGENKKSFIVISAFVRLVIALVLFLVAFAACVNIRSGFDENERYVLSFEDFVNSINDLERTKTSVDVAIKKKTAIIGFRENAEAWVCRNCHEDNGDTIGFPKTTDTCIGTACVCLCTEGFELGDSNLISCDDLYCLPITKNIADMTHVLDGKSWENGFVFANDRENVNGLKKYKIDVMTLYVDNVDETITVCNDDMKEYNKNLFPDDINYDSCIRP